MQITIHLSSQTRNIIEGNHVTLLEETLHYPENGKNAEEIQAFVAELAHAQFPTHIVTDSLFLIREIEMAGLPVLWVHHENGTIRTSRKIEDIGPLHILERQLEQCERYQAFKPIPEDSNKDTNESNLEKLEAIAEAVEGKLIRDYSGRGMSGTRCPAITCSNPNETLEEAGAHGIRGAKIDKMGHQYVLYWPYLEIEEQDDQPESESEE